MSGVNKAIIIGNLTKDVETRFMPNGDAVSNMTVATSEKWKDKNTGEQKEKAEFHRIVIFGKLASIAGEYLRKGSKVYIEGSLQTRKWTNQQGADQYTTEIVLQGFGGKMEMLDGKPQGAQQPAAQGGFQQQGQQNGGFQQQQQQPMQGSQQLAQKRQQAQQQQQQPAQQPAQQNQQSGGFQQQGQQQQKINPQEPDMNFDDDIPF